MPDSLRAAVEQLRDILQQEAQTAQMWGEGWEALQLTAVARRLTALLVAYPDADTSPCPHGGSTVRECPACFHQWPHGEEAPRP